MMIFQDRADAGKELLPQLHSYRERKDTLVIGLPRGGVVTAYEIAKGLKLPLDVICPMKIGAPNNPEYAVGAITETGLAVFNKEAIRDLGISESYLQNSTAKVKLEAQKRIASLRHGKKPLDIMGKIIILVDDGMATGLTMQAAIKSLRESKALKIVVAIPVAPPQAIKEMQTLADETICPLIPSSFIAVSQFYREFPEVSTDEVIQILKAAEQH